ncbi:MAG: hypothetical protein COX82_04750 [Candidatus Magasanikbacteria bacterium CG_4_10_14_0_2_um_filter_41_10]|uniref:Uncharacterized protein n=1 Tax=Candidatus Magasanikbacteria bacterium CG_4_10_14_0_2_um_filter_41_10 TaxID=1974638 RepID=A0A2M7V231_9BACT|nr:MAG: hypothetical protein COX82_04750 [Candidatus Magasanikbacteria bacterium CG_4_10_14_0_2_um_filter_41_10]
MLKSYDVGMLLNIVGFVWGPHPEGNGVGSMVVVLDHDTLSSPSKDKVNFRVDHDALELIMALTSNLRGAGYKFMMTKKEKEVEYWYLQTEH